MSRMGLANLLKEGVFRILYNNLEIDLAKTPPKIESLIKLYLNPFYTTSFLSYQLSSLLVIRGRAPITSLILFMVSYISFQSLRWTPNSFSTIVSSWTDTILFKFYRIRFTNADLFYCTALRKISVKMLESERVESVVKSWSQIIWRKK